MDKKEYSFEESLEKLESIVSSLEKGDVPLDESIKLFEEGTALIANCNKLLENAEQKVKLLQIDENGDPNEVPFDEGE